MKKAKNAKSAARKKPKIDKKNIPVFNITLNRFLALIQLCAVSRHVFAFPTEGEPPCQIGDKVILNILDSDGNISMGCIGVVAGVRVPMNRLSGQEQIDAKKGLTEATEQIKLIYGIKEELSEEQKIAKIEDIYSRVEGDWIIGLKEILMVF